MTPKFELIELIATAVSATVKDKYNEKAQGILDTFSLMADISKPDDAAALKAVNDIRHEIATGKIADVNVAFNRTKKALKKAWNEPEADFNDIMEGR